MFAEHTPIECYKIGRRDVWVKRDDLFASPPAPPLAKLRGVNVILTRFVADGGKVVGCFEASASRIGHGLAAACTAFGGLRCIVAYPKIKNRPTPPSVLMAESLGAEVLPLPNNFVAICHRQAARLVQSRGGAMLPFGLECPEAVAAVAREAATIPKQIIEGGTLVVACGSGVTLAGLLRGLTYRPEKIIGVSVGRSVDNIRRCLVRCDAQIPDALEVRAPHKLYREVADVECPFPCDAHYDLKAWAVLIRELSSLADPVLFWNVGG